MSNTDLEARLVDAGRRSADSPDPRFADQLESRLRAVHAEIDRPRRHASSLQVRRWLVVGVAAAVVTAVALVLLLPRTDPALALTVAVDTEVVLPDGSVVEGRVGLELPDGAIVRTGPNGRATAGGRAVPPGTTARVERGALVVVREDAPDDAPSPTATTTGVSRPPASTTTTAPPATRPSTTTSTTVPVRSTTTTAPTSSTTATERPVRGR